MFEERILQKIIRAWVDYQDHPHRDLAQRPLRLAELRAVLETAFLASLRREEDSPVAFSVVLASKSQIADGRSAQVVMELDQPLDYSEEAIVKLAPALDPNTTAIAVTLCDDDSVSYVIWGITFFGRSERPFEHINTFYRGTYVERPDALTLTAAIPGSLLIARGNAQIGRFASGDFIRAVPTPFSSRAMGPYIKQVIETNSGFQRHGDRYRSACQGILKRLLHEVSARCHGGTIVVVARDKIQQCKRRVDPKYTFEDSIGIESLLETRLLVPTDCEVFNLVVRLGFGERLDLLAHLACVDGALIVSSDWKVVAFGSRLTAREWDGDVLIGPDRFGNGGEEFDTSKLGTRHRSAIDFVGDCAGSIAFVISEDGPIRGFAKRDDRTVLCWPDCRVSMVAEDAKIHR